MPFLTQSALDELLATQRDLREGRLVRKEEPRIDRIDCVPTSAIARLHAKEVPPPVVAPVINGVQQLTDAVVNACEVYGLGDTNAERMKEVAANFRKARELTASGKNEREIITAIRMGPGK